MTCHGICFKIPFLLAYLCLPANIIAFAYNVHMITSTNFYLFLKIGSCLKDGGTFFLSWLGWSSNPLHLLQGTFNIMI